MGHEEAERIAVTIHSTDAILRAGLRSLLRSQPNLRIVNEGQREYALVIVIEDRITAQSIQEIRKVCAQSSASSKPLVLILTDQFQPRLLLPAVEAGVVCILRRHEEVATIVDAVMNALRGGAHFAPELQGALITRLEQIRVDVLEPNNLTATGLTERERNIIHLIAQGLDTAEIATQMWYSERTVKNILHGVMTRLHLQNRAHAVAYAMRTGAIYLAPMTGS
jgi:DNA-binding NarL/FixJ family response regulator